MKICSVLLFVSFWSAIPATHAAAATPAPLSAALFDIEVPSPALRDDAIKVGTMLEAFLSAEDEIFLVERKQLAEVLGEQGLGASGLVNAQSAARIGQLTGAKVLLISRGFAEGSSFTVVTKIIGTETGRVFAQLETLPPGEKRQAAIQSLADKIAGAVRKNNSDLVAKVETPEERSARLKKLVAGAKLPSLSVSIPEQHITHHLIDPAAETEIAKLLGEAGFPLFKASESGKAEYQITGEAFSEQAMRRGDFTSCRARVEIKVTEAATGRVVLQDRQTEVAADIAESTAAKTALQQAGAQLAERIAAKLAAAR